MEFDLYFYCAEAENCGCVPGFIELRKEAVDFAIVQGESDRNEGESIQRSEE